MLLGLGRCGGGVAACTGSCDPVDEQKSNELLGQQENTQKQSEGEI